MEKITTVGIDLAKSVFQVQAIDAEGRVVVAKSVRRRNFVSPLAKVPPSLITIIPKRMPRSVSSALALDGEAREAADGAKAGVVSGGRTGLVRCREHLVPEFAGKHVRRMNDVEREASV